MSENSDFPVIGPECFTNREATIICYKGENYYRACGAFVAETLEGGTSHCVKRVDHPSILHEDFDGRTLAVSELLEKGI